MDKYNFPDFMKKKVIRLNFKSVKIIAFIVFSATISCIPLKKKMHETGKFKMQRLVVHENKRFIQYEDGEPFFWLGDTGWLLFHKLNREEVELYLENRKGKGFNVIQAVLIHHLPQRNFYGDYAFINSDPSMPDTTPGNTFEDSTEYDYWDHIDWVIDQAEKRGIYMALVIMWRSAVNQALRIKKNDATWAKIYASFLTKRYRNKPNIIWINGGDCKGSENIDIWRQFGNTIKSLDPNHLMTFHPFGRTCSCMWFHNDPWLDFNMFQSGHRRYDQDNDMGFGQDNWRYVEMAYKKEPPKPVLDGEPSYEDIPQGLHDSSQPYWTAADVRRYAYWSVFAGSFGHTYGHNAIMQFHKPEFGKGAYGVRDYWYEAINDTGAYQMQYLKKLMLSRPFFERVPDQSLVSTETNGTKYDYVIATQGKIYAFYYTYTGRSFDAVLGKISGDYVKANWYNPKNGKTIYIGRFKNYGVKHFDPPGEKKDGNDWVLILDSD